MDAGDSCNQRTNRDRIGPALRARALPSDPSKDASFEAFGLAPQPR